jgi:hypothetical protein
MFASRRQQLRHNRHQANLARLLKKYRIHPANIRVGDKISKGYPRADFEDAWQRYCAPSVSHADPHPPDSHERLAYRRKALVAQALRDIESLLESGAISADASFDTEYFLARIQGQPEDVLAALELAVEQGLLAPEEDPDDG